MVHILTYIHTDIQTNIYMCKVKIKILKRYKHIQVEEMLLGKLPDTDIEGPQFRSLAPMQNASMRVCL